MLQLNYHLKYHPKGPDYGLVRTENALRLTRENEGLRIVFFNVPIESMIDDGSAFLIMYDC